MLRYQTGPLGTRRKLYYEEPVRLWHIFAPPRWRISGHPLHTLSTYLAMYPSQFLYNNVTSTVSLLRRRRSIYTEQLSSADDVYVEDYHGHIYRLR
jgi:hypothetical protein